MNNQITITINPSLQKLAASIGAVDVQKFMRDEIYKIALLIERNAKQLTPVNTGALRSSISTSFLIMGIGARVATNKDYAIFVHEGTRYMRSRPFMKKGAEFAEPQIAGQISKRIDSEFALAFKKL